MTIMPGDVILVKNLVFENGNIDNTQNGRPCVVLFTQKMQTEEIVNFLPLTTQTEKMHSHYKEQYTLLHVNKSVALVNLSYVYRIDKDEVEEVIDNIAKDYFRIIRLFKNYHQNSERYFISNCVAKCRLYEKHYNFVYKQLLERYKVFKERQKYYYNSKRLDKKQNEEDVIEKKLIKKRKIQYKIAKEEAILNDLH